MTDRSKIAIRQHCRLIQMALDRIRAETSRTASDPDTVAINRAVRQIVRSTPWIAHWVQKPRADFS